MTLLDSSATSHFNKPPDEYPLFGHCLRKLQLLLGKSSTPLQLCWYQCINILLALSNNLLVSVGAFTDNGYRTIFQPCNDGATVHDSNNITIMTTKLVILQGSQDANKLWHVPLLNPSCHICHHAPPCIYNANDLFSTKHIVCYLHTTQGFPTKAHYSLQYGMAASPLFHVS